MMPFVTLRQMAPSVILSTPPIPSAGAGYVEPPLPARTLRGAASVVGESVTRIRTVKEDAFHINGYPSDRVQQALGVYYDELIRLVAARLKKSIADAQHVAPVDRPVPLVVSGGTSMPEGFVQRFSDILDEIDPGITFAEIRAAADPLNTTAKGALVAALAGV